MGACAVEGRCFILNRVDEEPVRLDMAFPVSGPVAPKVMRSANGGCVPGFAYCIDDTLQAIRLLASFLLALEVFFEAVGKLRLTHMSIELRVPPHVGHGFPGIGVTGDLFRIFGLFEGLEGVGIGYLGVKG